jgi:hypothetical protein
MGALIHIYSYSPPSAMDNYATDFGNYYHTQAVWAEGETMSGQMYVFLAGQMGTGPALRPLERFNFSINTWD